MEKSRDLKIPFFFFSLCYAFCQILYYRDLKNIFWQNTKSNTTWCKFLIMERKLRWESVQSRFCRQKVPELAAKTISFSECLPHFENINSSN